MSQLTKRRWPAEWEKHQATWMAWPCREEIWSNGLEKARHAFAKVANTISEYEPVNMIVRAEDAPSAQKLLNSDIEIHFFDLDDSWARDISPLWVEEQLDGSEHSLALKFIFNAWGNKFESYAHDAKVAEHITQIAHSKVETHDVVLEGGSIHGNGRGILLTTKECLLNPKRNPQLSQDDIESFLLKTFGAKAVIWLNKGLYGDVDTDGHIDNIACFVDDKTVLTQSTDDRDSENFDIYHENREIIKDAGMELIEIPEPDARYSDGQRVPLSYINYYIANDLVVLPSFGCKQDQAAMSILRNLYPKRDIKQLDANEILVGGGGIHCITMQQPLIKSS